MGAHREGEEMAASRVRDGVLELAHAVDLSARVSSVFPMNGGSFFRLNVKDESVGDDLLERIRMTWPLVSASRSVNDLDGGVTVGVLVPERRVAWKNSLEMARGGVVYSVVGFVSKCVFASAVLVFLYGTLEKLR